MQASEQPGCGGIKPEAFQLPFLFPRHMALISFPLLHPSPALKVTLSKSRVVHFLCSRGILRQTVFAHPTSYLAGCILSLKCFSMLNSLAFKRTCQDKAAAY